MRFKLAELERQLPEDLFQAAQELSEKGEPNQLATLGKGVWVASCKDEQQYEVEVLLEGNYFKEGTCECGDQSKDALCAHTSAALLGIRSRKEKPVKKKISVLKVKRDPDKFNTSAVLDQVDLGDLKKFVKSYARQNRAFSLALQTRFAPYTESADELEKYLIIMEEARKSHRRSGSTFNFAGERSYLKICKELASQAAEASEYGDWANAIFINVALLEGLVTNIAFAAKSRKPFIEIIGSVLKNLEEILSYPLAPALQERVWLFLFNLMQTRVVGLKYAEEKIGSFLVRLSIEESDFEKLSENFKKHQKAVAVYSEAFKRLEIPRIKLAFRLKKQPLSNPLIDYSKNPQLLIFLVNYFLEERQLEIMEAIIKEAITLNVDEETMARIEDYWLTLADLTRNIELKKEVTLLRLKKSLDSKYLDILIQSGFDWDNFFEEKMVYFLELPKSESVVTIIGKIYFACQQPERLLRYISETETIALLTSYDHWLNKHNTKALQIFYPKFIKSYTKSHIGPKAAEGISKALDHIKELYGTQAKRDLKTFFKSEYKERTTLINIL